VHTARFAGPDATADDNINALLDALAGIPADNRTARFRTVVCYVEDGEPPRTFEGVCEGRILPERRGTGGFGYDPIFQPTGSAHSFAEMDAVAKNAISHRKEALDAFADFFNSRAARESPRS
jgi:XTP/dITP diphosphohydrolase